MGAPVGNQNAAKAKVWQAAIMRALDGPSGSERVERLNALAQALIDKAAEGDMGALKELGDRLDGKPAQAITADPDGEAFKHVFEWKRD